MKNKTIVWFALLLVLVLTLSACGKAKRGEYESTPIVYEAEAELLIANTLGEPVFKVDVTVLFAKPGEDIKQLANVSSEEGRILLKGLPNKSTVQIQLKADGYASQVLVLNTGDANNKVIKNEVLIKRQPPTTFDSSKTASVLAIDGAKVNVPAASFVDADGNVVMGDIDVTITPIDVSTPAGLEAFPGSFSGVFEDGEEAPLIVSYGTTEYQFTQDGKELQLKEGALADIEIPIYFDTHVNGDPIVEGDSIPLWYLNEETGIWEQEGFGTVARSAGSPTGFVLQGKVAHFSWWNCDVARRLRQSESVGGGGGGDSDEDIEMINVIFTASIDGDTDQFSQETRDSMLAHITATTRGMLATKLVDIDAPTDLLIPTSVNLCYSAYTNIYSESDPGVSFRFSSQERCQIFSKANDGMHINLRVFVGGEFSIEAQVPQTATVGTAFGACGTSPRIVTHNAAGSVSYKILNVASLPAGLVLSQSSGNIYGVPTEVVPAVNPRSRSLHIEATDELGRKAETIFNIELFDELEISGGAITPILQIDQPFILQDYFRISGGYSPYSYFESNTPAGAQVRIDDIGTRDVISLEGTPPSYTVNGQVPLYSKYPWEIQVEDQNCARSTHGYEFWVIHGPDIDDVKPSPSEVLIGELFSFTPVNNGAVADHWELLEGPEWLSITDGDGRLEGRPELSDLGAHRIRVLATNDVVASFDDGLVQDSIDLGQGRSILEFDLSVMPGEPEFLDFSNHTAVKNTAFSLTPTNTGGPVERWEIEGQPNWATFSTETGELAGTPSDVEVYSNIIIRAINSSGEAEYGPFTISVTETVVAPQLDGIPGTAAIGENFSFTPDNSGSSGSWSTSSGILPEGLVLNTGTGNISGLPAEGTVGSYGVTLRATNSAGSDELSISIEVTKGTQAALSFSNTGPVTKIYTDSPFINTVVGGSGIGNIEYRSNTPAIASVDPVSGEVTILDVGPVVISAEKAEDANYKVSTAQFELVVGGDVITLAGTPPNSVAIDGTLDFTPTVISGVVENWEIANKPIWADFDPSSGRLSGQPGGGDAGSYSEILITATNTKGGSDAIGPFDLGVAASPPEISGTPQASFVSTVLGVQSYQFIPTSTGGPVVKWELDNAPSWLSIVNSVTGEISGSPSYLQVGLYEDLILRAIGDQGIFDQIGPFSIEVLPPIPSLQNVNIIWYTEVDKSVQFQALSPTQANEWSISPGVGANTDFPWLSLDSATGMLSGTPPNDALGTHQFTLTASNGSGSNTSTLNLGVQAPAAPGFLEKLGDVRVPAYRTSSFSLASQEQANFVIEPAVGPGSNYPWITLDVFDNQAADMYVSPDIENVGEHIFTVTASNGGGSDNFTMKVIVPDEIKLPVNLIQNQNGIVIEWQGLADASLDYQLSIAAEPGVTSDNYQTLSEGAHFSSISPPHTIESLVTGKPYFLQIEVSSDSGKRLYSQKLTATPSRFNDTGSTRCVPQSIFYQADPCVTNNAGAQDATLGSDATNSYWIADPMVFDYRWHVVEGFHFKKVEANSDTCVQDQVTGLLWEKKSSTNGNLRDYTNRYTWASAQDYVAAVNSQGLCGRSDWRLPNILELSSISDVADNSFDLEKAHFIFFNNNTEQASHTDYWTADEDAENNTNAWLHSLALETIIDTKVNERSVRLVSGIPMASTLIANGDGTVTDTTTGLLWKLCPEGMSYDNGGDANAANDSCTGSPATLRDNQLFEHAAGVSGADGVVVPTDSEGLGYNDWRVPNIKELQSIVNYSSAVLGFRDPLIGASLGIYWSSTLIQDNSSEGLLGIDFSAANVSKQSWGGVGAHMLRLVRAAVSPRLWLRDADGDGVGVGEDTQYSIHKPDGYVNEIYDYSGVPVYDCNDADASVSPLADDIGGDGIDNNCNGRIDDYFGGVEF